MSARTRRVSRSLSAFALGDAAGFGAAPIGPSRSRGLGSVGEPVVVLEGARGPYDGDCGCGGAPVSGTSGRLAGVLADRLQDDADALRARMVRPAPDPMRYTGGGQAGRARNALSQRMVDALLAEATRG